MNLGISNVVIAALLMGIAQMGCTSSAIVSSVPSNKRLSFVEFNLRAVAASNDDMRVVFRDNTTLDVKGVRAELDSTSWLNPTTGLRQSAQTALIKKVTFRHSAPGEGAGIGALVGAGMGVVGAAIHMAGDKSEFAPIALVVYPPIGAAGGVILGVIVGVVKGHSDEYEFQNALEKR